MTIVELSKAQVIEALGAERLVSATFVDGTGRVDSCAVCAVGAVVRKCLSSRTPGFVADSIAWGLAVHDAGIDRRLMRLSMAYERAVSGTTHGDFAATAKQLERGRRAAIAYVRKHFPARVRIDIGDAKPRRGMQVVK